MNGRLLLLLFLVISLEVFSLPYREFVVKDEWYYTRQFNSSMNKIVKVDHRKLNYTRFFLKMMNDRHDEIVKLMGNAKEIKRT